MRGAAERGEQPFAAAVELSRSLFSVQQVALGVEHALATGPKPCGLWVDAERARFVRRPIVEILNSAEEWEPRGELIGSSLGEVLLRKNERWIPALRLPKTIERFALGNLCRLREKKIYGRELPLASASAVAVDLQLVKPLRKLLQAKLLPENELRARVQEFLPQWSGGGVVDEFVKRGALLSVRIDFSTSGNRGLARFVRPGSARPAGAHGPAAGLPGLLGTGA